MLNSFVPRKLNLVSLHSVVLSPLRPAELQRLSGEHADSLLGQREELASASQLGG